MSGGLPRLQVGIVVAAAAVLGLVLLSLVANLQKVERVVRTPPGAEARRNPLLAAERFLHAMGIEAHSAARLGELPPTDHVLILAVEDRILTRTRTDRLLDWMSDGGLLIFGPYLEDGEPAAESTNKTPGGTGARSSRSGRFARTARSTSSSIPTSP